jgi:hypothetical protein
MIFLAGARAAAECMSFWIMNNISQRESVGAAAASFFSLDSEPHQNDENLQKKITLTWFIISFLRLLHSFLSWDEVAVIPVGGILFRAVLFSGG